VAKHATEILHQMYVAASLNDIMTSRADNLKKQTMKSSQREKKQKKKIKQKHLCLTRRYSAWSTSLFLTSSEAQTIANSFMDHLKSILEVNLSITNITSANRIQSFI